MLYARTHVMEEEQRKKTMTWFALASSVNATASNQVLDTSMNSLP